MRRRITPLHNRGGHKTVSVRAYFFPVSKSRSDDLLHPLSNPQSRRSARFFSKETRKTIEVTCRLSEQPCLRTDAKGSTRAPILYQHKKRNAGDTGVTAENTASKAIADPMLESAQIAVDVRANRTRARIGISSETGSYVALNWQRVDINARCASRGRRFPTPQPTTSHVFRPNQRRNVRLSLRFWLPNSSVPMVNVTPQRPWGAGGVR
jgi:hypothetical protein